MRTPEPLLFLIAFAPTALAITCPSGQYSPNNINCFECPADTYCQAGVIARCPEHSTAPMGSTSISQCICQANSYLSQNQCLCNEGYILDSERRCSLCPANAFCPDQHTVRNCSNHGLSLPGQSGPEGCNACPAGYAMNSRTNSPISCRPCREGFSCPNATVERQCPAGTFAPPLATECVECPANTHSAAGARACTPCDSQGLALSPAGSTSSAACICLAGYYMDGSRSRCIGCPAGFACANNMVAPCAQGTFSGARFGTCQQCPLGTYEDSQASPQCKTCPGGERVQKSHPLLETMMPAVIERGTATTGSNGFYISMTPFLREAQGANVTSWSFWASRAGCVVTPVILRGTYRTPGTATGAIDFFVVLEGTTRTSTKAGEHNFTFIDDAPTYLAPEYGFNAVANMAMTQTFFGWHFTGQECFLYDVASGAQTYAIWKAPPYNDQVTLYSYDGIAPTLSQLWSVRVGSVRTATIPATSAVGAVSILSCICPDGFQQLANGQCQGICPPGSFIADPSSSVCSPCPQGSYCLSSNRLPCPAGTSSLGGASACTPCVSPGDGTDIQLHTCGLKTCAARQPVPIGTSQATSTNGAQVPLFWTALGNITVAVGSVHGMIATPWLTGDTVIGMVLNPKSDRPYAMLQVDLDQGNLGLQFVEIAVQFSYMCMGVACPDFLRLELSHDQGVTFEQMLHITDFTTSRSNWVTIASPFFLPTSDEGTLPPPTRIRISAEMKLLSCILWVGNLQIASLGDWNYEDITRMRLLTTEMVDVQRFPSLPTDALQPPYMQPVPSTNLRLTDNFIRLSIEPYLATVANPTGISGVAIYPDYDYYVSLQASGNGTLTIEVNDVDSWTGPISSHTSSIPVRFQTTRPPVKFHVRVTGTITIKAPSLSIRKHEIGCQTCLANYWCNLGFMSSCFANALSAPGASNPSECYCKPGYYGTPDACTPCPANHFCPGGEFNTVCPNGTRTDPDIDGGMRAIRLDECIPCKVDDYCANGRTSMCPGNATSPISSWDITHCICDPGYYGTAPDCRLCEPGFYCFEGVKTACTPNAISPWGSYNSTQCFCVPGYYGQNNEECQVCPEASFCSSGLRSPCPTHMWSPEYSSVISNCTCDYGAYPVKVACALCSAGTYKPTRGTSPCSICSSGTFATARGAVSSAVCVGCAPGSYTLGAGQYQCQACAAGFYASGIASSSCTECWAGSYSTMGSSDCILCLAGTYSNVRAAPSITTCESCPVGSWSYANSTSCTLCGACSYWKFPATVYFEYTGQQAVMLSTERNIRFAVSMYNQVYMAMGVHLYRLDLTTGERSAPLQATGPSVNPWFYSSIEPSSMGNYLYVVRNPNVYRLDLDMGAYDKQYPSNQATHAVEDNSGDEVVLWIVQPTRVRKVMPLAAEDIASFPVNGANYACLHPNDPHNLYVTGTFGLRRMDKVRGNTTNLRTGVAHTVCRITPDGLFILLASATSRNLVAFSLFDGSSFNVLGGTVTGLLFDHTNMVVGVDSNGIVNISYVAADSRSCIPGQFGRNGGMISPDSCTLCPKGNLCPGGANVTACSPGTFSNETGQRQQAQCTVCPAGSFCKGAICPSQMDCSIHPTTGVCSGPDCTDGDLVETCPEGRYSTRRGLTKASDCPLCVAGFWCPDALTMRPCPNNTMSAAGAHDLSECVCAPGYQCIITKVVHASVVIAMSPDQFTPAIQAQYRAAIAAAAGIDVSLVSIQGFFTVSSPPSGRRLLSHRRGTPWESRAIEVHTLIHQTHMVELSNLDTHLNNQGLPPHRGVTMTLKEEVVQSYRQEW
jgi:hypothetical protein